MTQTSHAPGTPAADGFAMPAEWEPHAGCLMSWPTRHELWAGRIEEARRDYAAVAAAVARFEPVLMVCNPGDEAGVKDRCGSDVEVLPIPIDDSWARDNGPVFVRDGDGRIAAVSFRFNAWGERWHPHDSDAALGPRVAEHLGMRCYRTSLVLEGGAFLVDGEGTLLTTEQCLLNPNRNPDLTREQIEQQLRDHLGVQTVVWLGRGHHHDTGPEGTDGHLDGILHYVAPGRVLLDVPSDPAHPGHAIAQDNLARLAAATDARGRRFDVLPLDPGAEEGLAYANLYLANGGVVVPVAGGADDARALDEIGAAFPDREVVAVPGEVIAFGGGGPHCITQQIPAGPAAPA
jgi:agmatine deiminase